MKINKSNISKGGKLVGNYLRTELQLGLGKSIDKPATATQSLRQWLKELGREGVLPTQKGRILVTALRSKTWIEWGVYAACVLRLKGYETTLLYRKSQVDRLYSEAGWHNFWKKASLIPGVKLLNLEEIQPLEKGEPWIVDVSESISAAAVAYNYHIEEADVLAQSQYHKSLLEMKQLIVRSGLSLLQHLQSSGQSYLRFICYSGLIEESPGLLAAAQKFGLTTVCLEGWAWRPGHMIYNLNSPAMEYNVTGWMKAAGEWNTEKEESINKYLKFLDGDKQDDKWLNNFYRIQRDKISEELPQRIRDFVADNKPIFLLAPNVIGDSSLLKRETIFPGLQIWTRQVIEWFKARPHLKLIIRAHPAEVWVGGKCAVHMGKVSSQFAKDVPNVLVIDSTDKINTFSLIPFARAGLAWLSSAGVDFVVRGLPTVVAANPKYTGLGIVEEPASVEAYFDLLERWSVEAPRPTAEQIRSGKKYLHMVFKGFSFEAGSRTFYANRLILNRMPSQSEHDRFFRIILGEEPMPDCQ